jgi:hypothetical protein
LIVKDRIRHCLAASGESFCSSAAEKEIMQFFAFAVNCFAAHTTHRYPMFRIGCFAAVSRAGQRL